MVVGSKHEFDLSGDIAAVQAALDTAEDALGKAFEALRPALGSMVLSQELLTEEDHQLCHDLIARYTRMLESNGMCVAGVARALGIDLDGPEPQDGELAAAPDPSQTALPSATSTTPLGLPSGKAGTGKSNDAADAASSNGVAKKATEAKDHIPKLDVSKAAPRPGHDYWTTLARPLQLPNVPKNGQILLAVGEDFVAIGGRKLPMGGRWETACINVLLEARYIGDGYIQRGAAEKLLGSPHFIISTFGATLSRLQDKLKLTTNRDLYETTGTGARLHYRLHSLLVPISSADLLDYQEPEEVPKG